MFYGFAQNLNWHSIGLYITKEVLECNSSEYSLKQGFLRSLMVNTEKLSLTSLECRKFNYRVYKNYIMSVNGRPDPPDWISLFQESKTWDNVL